LYSWANPDSKSFAAVYTKQYGCGEEIAIPVRMFIYSGLNDAGLAVSLGVAAAGTIGNTPSPREVLQCSAPLIIV
jgi:hypothetical protein